MQNRLTASDNCIALITSEEQLRLVPYNDPDGFATVGWGHLIRRGPVEPTDEPITYAQAIALLQSDLRDPENTVNDLVTIQLNQNQFDAVVDFVYNEGSGTFEKSSLLTCLNNGDFAGATKVFGEYIYADHKPLGGLIARRKKEAELFNKPV
jgi:lysozyme